jgi:hypothetical protein
MLKVKEIFKNKLLLTFLSKKTYVTNWDGFVGLVPGSTSHVSLCLHAHIFQEAFFCFEFSQRVSPWFISLHWSRVTRLEDFLRVPRSYYLINILKITWEAHVNGLLFYVVTLCFNLDKNWFGQFWEGIFSQTHLVTLLRSQCYKSRN